jgi:hypothetical protein
LNKNSFVRAAAKLTAALSAVAVVSMFAVLLALADPDESVPESATEITSQSSVTSSHTETSSVSQETSSGADSSKADSADSSASNHADSEKDDEDNYESKAQSQASSSSKSASSSKSGATVSTSVKSAAGITSGEKGVIGGETDDSSAAAVPRASGGLSLTELQKTLMSLIFIPLVLMFASIYFLFVVNYSAMRKKRMAANKKRTRA